MKKDARLAAKHCFEGAKFWVGWHAILNFIGPALKKHGVPHDNIIVALLMIGGLVYYVWNSRRLMRLAESKQISAEQAAGWPMGVCLVQIWS
jgi:hypothetical protein